MTDRKENVPRIGNCGTGKKHPVILTEACPAHREWRMA
jgi:hypothetical protein